MNHQSNQPGLTFTNRFTFSAGVILPAIAITIEASTHVCAEMFFDPIPTVWHMMLVLFVPLAQLHVWFTVRRGLPDRLMLAGLANAVAIGISIFYALLYVPSMPLALATVVIAVGLLPLSPLLSLIAALIMRYQLRQIAGAATQTNFALRTKGLLIVLGLTLGFIGLIQLPATLTRYGLQLATSSSPETRTEGIRFLRTYGNKDQLLRSCYPRSRDATDILADLFWIQNPVKVDMNRKIYYRVTGETFDMYAPPQRVEGRPVPLDPFDFEDDQDGTRIAGKLKGLSLSSSQLEGSIDADGGVGYLQWTLGFKNESESAKEARTEIQLPPGGVVSRVSLLDNSGERLAVVGGSVEVGQDYYQGNPVFVTTAGRDRILVQVFPVAAYGGEMKVRLGITVPLLLESKIHERLLLPHFEDRNFRIPDHVSHSVWFESTRPVGTEYGGLYYGQTPNGGSMLAGLLTDKDLSRPQRSILVSRRDADTGTWSENPFEADGSIVKQWIEERTPAHLRRIVLVIDTSASMAHWEPEINAALGALSPEIDLKLVLADADWLHESERKNLVATGLESVSTLLASTTFAGGADNAPALRKAWDLAAEAPGNNAIVWIHGPQLVQLESVDGITRRWQGRPYGPLLYSVQTSTGSDEVAKKLDGINEVKSVVRVGTLRADLERLFGQLSGQLKTYEFVRSVKQIQSPPTEESEGHKTSEHLAQLWASDEIARIVNTREESSHDVATNLAVRYQLVTPVSDATILDTDKQYPRSERPWNSIDEVPTRQPEIETLFLAAVLFVIGLGWLRYHHIGGGSFTT